MIGIEGRVVDLLKDLVLVRSTASNPEGLEHGLRLIQNHVEDVPGICVDSYSSGGRPSFVARPGVVQDIDTLLVAHVDVVEAPDELFHARVEGDRIYGRGTGDMKGQIAILTEVFKDVLRRNPTAPLGLMITTDEESGGEHGVRYLLEDEGYRCEQAIIPDSGRLNDLVVVEKGLISGRILARGKSGHGSRPWLADNAIHNLLHNLDRVVAHFARLAPDEHEADTDNHWHPTLSTNIIGTDNHTMNRIPDAAWATVDIRYPETMTHHEVINQLNAQLDDRAEFVADIIAEPLTTDPDPRFVALTEEVTGHPVHLTREHGGSDGRHFTRNGMPVIMSRPDVGGLHSDREWIHVPSMLAYYEILSRYLNERFAT